MTDRHEARAKAQTAIAAALEEYAATEDGGNGEGVVSDWILTYSTQKIDEDGDLAWRNSWMTPPQQNPNTSGALAHWAGNDIEAYMLDSTGDDDGSE